MLADGLRLIEERLWRRLTLAGHRARPRLSDFPALRSRPVQLGAAATMALLVLGVICWALVRQPGTRAAGDFAPAPGPATDPPTPSAEPSPSASALPSPSLPPSASPSATRSAAPAPKPTTTPPKPPTGGQPRKFVVTLYGARDNDPPGSSAIAFPTVHRQAGGTGTFGDPITFATSKDELAVGTKIYYAPLKRYFVMEDACESCENEWRDGRRPHIDLYAGGSTNAGIVACENSLTPSGQVEVLVDPPAGLPVVSTPIYNGSRCFKP
jgi:hypothetical protein